jgi:hypothetical protein
MPVEWRGHVILVGPYDKSRASYVFFGCVLYVTLASYGNGTGSAGNIVGLYDAKAVLQGFNVMYYCM